MMSWSLYCVHSCETKRITLDIVDQSKVASQSVLQRIYKFIHKIRWGDAQAFHSDT